MCIVCQIERAAQGKKRVTLGIIPADKLQAYNKMLEDRETENEALLKEAEALAAKAEAAEKAHEEKRTAAWKEITYNLGLPADGDYGINKRTGELFEYKRAAESGTH